jgi:hypothetical protein
MSAPLLLTGRAVWQYLSPALRRAKNVHAAISYFGQGGARLAPLRRGHTLVVDMSLKACSQGVTDPREIRKLIRKGVQVFSLENLHAKTLVIDDSLVVGSANVSHNSADTLEEAALVTTNTSSARTANRFIEQLCTPPAANLDTRWSSLFRCAGSGKAPG